MPRFLIVFLLLLFVVPSTYLRASEIDEVYPQSWGAKEDGITDDTTAVQAAIDAAPDGSVVVMTGLSAIGPAGIAITDRHSLALVGRGPGAGFTALALTTQTLATMGSTFLAVNSCVNCRLEGLYVDAGGFAHNAIGLSDATTSVISNTTIIRAGRNASLFSFGGARNRFSGNVIDGTNVGGSVRGLWIGNTNATEVEIAPIVSDNQIYATSATGIGGVMIDGVITNNHIEGAGGAGIALAASGPVSTKNVAITGNTITGSSFHGIQSDCRADSDVFPEAISISGNTIEANATAGIYVVRAKQWAITGNTIRNNGRYGIYVDGGSHFAITGNVLYDSRSGVSRTQVDGITVRSQLTVNTSDVNISGNSVYNHITRGIEVVNTSPHTIARVSINNNVAVGNDVNGIGVIDTAAKQITDIIVVGNLVRNNGTELRFSTTITPRIVCQNLGSSLCF